MVIKDKAVFPRLVTGMMEVGWDFQGGFSLPRGTEAEPRERSTDRWAGNRLHTFARVCGWPPVLPLPPTGAQLCL